MTIGMEGTIERIDEKGWLTLSLLGYESLFWVSKIKQSKLEKVHPARQDGRCYYAPTGEWFPEGVPIFGVGKDTNEWFYYAGGVMYHIPGGVVY